MASWAKHLVLVHLVVCVNHILWLAKQWEIPICYGALSNFYTIAGIEGKTRVWPTDICSKFTPFVSAHVHTN